jgi:DnaJ family protein C protein 28
MSSIEEDNAVERSRARGADQPNELQGEGKRLRQPEPIAAWDSLVERKIKEAQKQGLFDDLPGKGEPLDLSENPFLDPSWRMAYKLLRDHGFAPEWIELDKEIRIELERLRQGLAESKRWYDEALAGLEGKTGHQAEEERAWVEVYWERRLNSLAPRIDELNEKIGLFNLKVPIASLQRRRVSIEEELQRLSSG